MDTYTYDALGRLTHVTSNYAPAIAYSYDVLGQRVAKSVGGTVTRFVWRGGHVLYETNAVGVMQRSYTWGASADDLIAIRDHAGAAEYVVVQDGLRSVRGLIRRGAGAGGTWIGTRRYRVYGQALDSTGAMPSWLRFGWAGAQYDVETGFYYLRNRYYDPRVGRFTQEDPIGYAGGGNLHAYGADPTSGRDPSGTIMNADVQYAKGPNPYTEGLLDCVGTTGGCGGGGGSGNWMDDIEAWLTEMAAEQIMMTSYAAYAAAWQQRTGGLEGADAGQRLSEEQFVRIQRALVRGGPQAHQSARMSIGGLTLRLGALTVDVDQFYTGPIGQDSSGFRPGAYNSRTRMIYLNAKVFGWSDRVIANIVVHEGLHSMGLHGLLDVNLFRFPFDSGTLHRVVYTAALVGLQSRLHEEHRQRDMRIVASVYARMTGHVLLLAVSACAYSTTGSQSRSPAGAECLGLTWSRQSFPGLQPDTLVLVSARVPPEQVGALGSRMIVASRAADDEPRRFVAAWSARADTIFAHWGDLHLHAVLTALRTPLGFDGVARFSSDDVASSPPEVRVTGRVIECSVALLRR